MKKRLSEIERQIGRLQQEAKAIRDREVGEVVARIRSAIAHYGLGVDDLFEAPRGAARRKRGGPAAKKKAAGVVRYRDADGRSWTGHGKRPNWFKAAIESGKTPEDLAVKA